MNTGKLKHENSLPAVVERNDEDTVKISSIFQKQVEIFRWTK